MFANNDNSVTSLGDFYFFGRGSLTSITIRDSVTSLGDGCFAYCKNLTSITIPNSITHIGNRCFTACDNLYNVNTTNKHPEILKLIEYANNNRKRRYDLFLNFIHYDPEIIDEFDDINTLMYDVFDFVV